MTENVNPGSGPEPIDPSMIQREQPADVAESPDTNTDSRDESPRPISDYVVARPFSWLGNREQEELVDNLIAPLALGTGQAVAALGLNSDSSPVVVIIHSTSVRAAIEAGGVVGMPWPQYGQEQALALAQGPAGDQTTRVIGYPATHQSEGRAVFIAGIADELARMWCHGLGERE